MDKLHEENRNNFEAHYNANHHFKINPTMRTVEGYSSLNAGKAFDLWNAAIASIVVDCEEPDSYLTADGTRLAYKAYIRSIGLSIKGE